MHSPRGPALTLAVHVASMMTVDEAERAFEHALERRASQHRYIAEAQREIAARRAILPDLDLDVARAGANLDSARGAKASWPGRDQQRQVRSDVDRAIHSARLPADALSDPRLTHRYSGDLYGSECWAGQLHEQGACGKTRDDHQEENDG